jgi:hypothetical protein
MARNRGVDVTAVQEDFFATTPPSSLLQRFATTAGTAGMIADARSAQASATTGAARRVDGTLEP